MTSAASALQFDEHGVASLDGVWELYPGDHLLADLDDHTAEDIVVPGGREAPGRLEPDGAAWYRRTVHLDDTAGQWVLRFAGVAAMADVYVNGAHLVTSELPLTPFETDPGAVLRPGTNEIAVRTKEARLEDPTCSGIWQSVTLCRQGLGATARTARRLHAERTSKPDGRALTFYSASDDTS